MRESSRLSTPVDLSKRRSVIRTSLASSSRSSIRNASTFFWENEHLVIFRTSDASSPTSSVRQESAERVCSVQVRFSLSVSSGVRRWISSIYSISSDQYCGDIIEKAHKIKEFHVLRFIASFWKGGALKGGGFLWKVPPRLYLIGILWREFPRGSNLHMHFFL